MPGLHLLDHPLAKHHLTHVRSRDTQPGEFRRHVGELVKLLAFDATRDLRVRETTVITPLCETTGHVIDERVGLVPILRAGLGMVDPLLTLLPEAEVWHLGLYRDEQTARPVEYYRKLPEGNPVETAIVLDPMLATGGSALLALDALKKWGVARLKLLAVIASAPGVETVAQEFPEASIHVCVVDPELNDRKFIVPGLGDAGDRSFNTLGE
ncbi:MAG: uracil phosphoribosyltransferase [Planctomycetota bacterium]|nr:MAG: uracil phosphoribosyltransferase [Planctomycetota bacterium]REJ97895.1 MAG: uracil phosphoribosyltransferase [Planctomycetota bacterium]REK25665.1 MAG: uracil phosphoribosyltransferase [Planctomycetota bacterium]REK31655.1 MAG: uracil phosphoribosyltransferase [Planctomycetota bacterium]